MLDTLEKIETPEGVELSLRLAGPLPRLLAWLIDLMLKIGIVIGTAILFGWMGDFFVGLWLLIVFFSLWLYNVLFEVLGNGATPGKRALNLQVLHSNGAPVGWYGSVIRNFLRVIDLLPSLYALGFVTTLSNARFQRLGDIAADTVVAHRYEQPKVAIDSSLEDAAPLRLPLSRDEQRAVMQFGERAGDLSKERSIELASILGAVINVDGEEAVQKLLAHANWLSGRK